MQVQIGSPARAAAVGQAAAPAAPLNPVALVNATLARHGLASSSAAAGVTLVVRQTAATHIDIESLRLLLVHRKVLFEDPQVTCDFLLLAASLLDVVHRFYDQLVGSAAHVLSWQRSTPAYSQMLMASTALSLLEHMVARNTTEYISSSVSLQPTDVDCLYHVVDFLVKNMVLLLTPVQLRVAPLIALLCTIIASSLRVLLVKSALGSLGQDKRAPFTRFAKFVVSQELWSSAVFTFTLMSCYQEVVLGLIESLVHGHHRQLFENADETAASLFVTQLATKPLPQAAVASGVFSRVVRKGVFVSPQTCVFHHMSLIKRALTHPPLIRGQRVAKLIVRIIREMPPEKIGYLHIFALGLLDQLPHVSLSNEAELVLRARRTHLCDESTLTPGFCRFVLAMIAGETLASREGTLSTFDSITHGRSSNPFSPSEFLVLYQAAVEELSQRAALISAKGKGRYADVRYDELVPYASFAKLVLEYSANARALSAGNETLASFEGKILSVCETAASVTHLAFVDLANRENSNFSKFPKNVVDVAFRMHSFSSKIASKYTAGPESAKIALEIVAYTFPVFFSVASNAPKSQEKVMLQALQRVMAQLASFSQYLSPSQCNALVGQLAREYCGTKSKNRPVQYRLLAFCSTLREKDFVRRISTETLVRHWVPLTLSGITNSVSVRLAEAAHDVLASPMIYKRSIAPLLAPTYASLFAPDAQSRYGPPPLPLLRRFAGHVRRVCQGLEQVDEGSMSAALQDASVKKELGTASEHLSSLTPISAALVVVQSTYESCTRLLPSQTKAELMRRDAYLSALFNLVQVSSALLTSRVCAACESIILAMTKAEQVIWMGFLTKIVEGSENILTKKGLVEWLVRLEQKVKAAQASRPQRSKL
jgi:hypothetical protein